MIFLHLLDFLLEILGEKTHEEIHLRSRPLPVLRGERVDRQHLDAEIDAYLHDVKQGSDARAMACRADEALSLRPASVAVHDDGDMARPLLLRHAIVERHQILFSFRCPEAQNLLPHIYPSSYRAALFLETSPRSPCAAVYHPYIRQGNHRLRPPLCADAGSERTQCFPSAYRREFPIRTNPS